MIDEAVTSAVGVRKFMRWDKGIIPFYIADNHPLKAEILQAIQTLNSNTVLWFKPATSTNINHIKIIDGSGCYSGIGKPLIRYSHSVSIGLGCNSQGIIIHELLHTAGLFHEQSRSDRDNYVNIYWDNIQKEEKYNYEMAPWIASLDIDYYNWASVMHYGCNDFAIDPTKKTIESKNARVAIGQRTGLSAGDVNAIQKMYYNLPTNRGKPAFTSQPLPALSYSDFCKPVPIVVPPATQIQCKAWQNQLAKIDQQLDEGVEDINERKKLLQRQAALTSSLNERCN